MKDKYNIIFFLLFLIIFLSCNGSDDQTPEGPKEELLYINDMIIETELDYEEAKKELLVFKEKYPDFYFEELGLNADILIFECYQTLGEFDEIEANFDETIKAWKPNLISVNLGYDYYDIVLCRAFVKVFNIPEAVKIINAFNKINIEQILANVVYNKKLVTKTLDIMYSVFLSRIALDSLMSYVISKKSDSLDIKNDDIFIQKNFGFLLDYYLKSKNKFQVRYLLFTLINYQFSDGEYYSRVLFNSNIFREYLEKYKKKRLLKNDDLALLKAKSYNTNFPEELNDIWHDVF